MEWLGEVPEHWEIRKISSICTKITNGYVGPTRDILVDDGVRYLQSLHIKGNRIKFDDPYFVTDAWSKEHHKSILETGDVLIVQTGDIGQVSVVTDEFADCTRYGQVSFDCLWLRIWLHYCPLDVSWNTSPVGGDCQEATSWMCNKTALDGFR